MKDTILVKLKPNHALALELSGHVHFGNQNQISLSTRLSLSPPLLSLPCVVDMSCWNLCSACVLFTGYSGLLEIQVGTSIPADSYTLKLDGAGGLVFTNTTSITLDPLTHLTFIQTDKSIYKASQLSQYIFLLYHFCLLNQCSETLLFRPS